jgi:folate-binding protein YgfZ
MFILRSKVTVKDVSDQWNVLGFYGDAQQATNLGISQQSVAMILPEVLVNNYFYSRVLIANPMSEDVDQISEGALSQWETLEVLSAIPRIVQATQEQFVPQMINFESVGGVDFKKGCYPGQEIVARSQYRGSIKRRLQLAHLDTPIYDQDISPGTELFLQDDSTQPAGMVVLSSINFADSTRVDFQIECKLEAMERGEIRLGSSDGPVLKIDPLPYPLIEV